MVNIKDVEYILDEVIEVFTSAEAVAYYTGLSDKDAEKYFNKLIEVYDRVSFEVVNKE